MVIFGNAGKENTERVLKLAMEKAAAISAPAVVLPSRTGETAERAVKMAEAVGYKGAIVAVRTVSKAALSGGNKMTSEKKKELTPPLFLISIDESREIAYNIDTGSRKVSDHPTRHKVSTKAVRFARSQDGFCLFTGYFNDLDDDQTKSRENHDALVIAHKAPPPNRLGSGAARPPATDLHYNAMRPLLQRGFPVPLKTKSSEEIVYTIIAPCRDARHFIMG